MRGPPPPLRFLGLVVGGWVAVRILVLAPGWTDEPAEVAAQDQGLPASAALPDAPPAGGPALVLQAEPAREHALAAGPWRRASAEAVGSWPDLIPAPALPSPLAPSAQPFQSVAALPPPPPGLAQLFPPARPPAERQRRWAGSAWVFVRDGDEASALAPAGELGGSQAGARLTYRLFGRRAPLALSGRIYVPIDRPEGAEAAVGVDWRPLAGIPIHLLAERRQALGEAGRSDFALTVYGGGERRVGPVRVEAWGQAGAVGVEDPDLFADGLVRATARVGPLDVGGGVWGGAQPDLARLDAGPHVSARLPLEKANLRLMAEWRFRIAGDAAPGSGPALTLASDF